jgi:hypothetical protein
MWGHKGYVGPNDSNFCEATAVNQTALSFL